jgi:hypothetical protein
MLKPELTALYKPFPEFRQTVTIVAKPACRQARISSAM